MFKTCVRVLCLKALAAGENNRPPKKFCFCFCFLFVLIVGCGEILSTVFNPVVHFKPQSFIAIFFCKRLCYYYYYWACTTFVIGGELWVILLYFMPAWLQDRTELEVDVFI